MRPKSSILICMLIDISDSQYIMHFLIYINTPICLLSCLELFLSFSLSLSLFSLSLSALLPLPEDALFVFLLHIIFLPVLLLLLLLVNFVCWLCSLPSLHFTFLCSIFIILSLMLEWGLSVFSISVFPSVSLSQHLSLFIFLHLCLSFSLSLSPTLSPTLSVSPTLSLSLPLSLSLSLSPSLPLSLPLIIYFICAHPVINIYWASYMCKTSTQIFTFQSGGYFYMAQIVDIISIIQ